MMSFLQQLFYIIYAMTKTGNLLLENFTNSLLLVEGSGLRIWCSTKMKRSNL